MESIESSREAEQQRVGLPEQLVVAVVRTAAAQIGGQRHAVAALVDRVHGPSHRHRVERVEADPLMHQHTAIIEGVEHAHVTACYGNEKSVAGGLEPLH